MVPPELLQASAMRAPAGASTPNSAVPTKKQRVTGTGATAAHNATALKAGEYATLKNGAEPIRVAWGDTTGRADTDAATGTIRGPYARFDWLVSPPRTGDGISIDGFVAAVAVAGGAATFEFDVWTSSGPRAGE